MADTTFHDRMLSWDGDGDALVGIQAIGDDRDLLAVKTRVLLEPAVRQLSRRDRDILRMLLAEGRTQADVSAALDIEPTEFSVLLRRILDDLRRASDGYGAEHPGA